MRYELIDKNNLILATRVQLEIFPKEIAYYSYKLSIEDNHEHYKYYLVYKDNVIIGITGIYTHCNYEDESIWLGWYGILEEYRLHGFGTEVLIDTFKMAQEEAKKNSKIKYFRLYTSSRDNAIAQILYRKFMTISEQYNNPDDVNYDGTCLIYGKPVFDTIDKVEPWNSRNINLKQEEENIINGFKEFIELTNGDIHIQIAPTGEVF